jgi:hypothetical protein
MMGIAVIKSMMISSQDASRHSYSMIVETLKYLCNDSSNVCRMCGISEQAQDSMFPYLCLSRDISAVVGTYALLTMATLVATVVLMCVFSDWFIMQLIGRTSLVSLEISVLCTATNNTQNKPRDKYNVEMK